MRYFREINIDLNPEDIENVERIGQFHPARKWPRPVKVTFVEEGARDRVLYFKSRLRCSQAFKEFKISKEEPRDIRIKRAMFRQAALIAQNKGLDLFMTYDFVTIEGVNYGLENVEAIPLEYTIAGTSPKKSPVKIKIPMSSYVKCRKQAERVTFVVPSLVKTCKGLTFCSEDCFLSNFFACSITYRGRKFSFFGRQRNIKMNVL